MDFLPYSQEYMLVVSIMSGMVLGFIWDIYRLFRHYVKLGALGTALGDIAYWLISVYLSLQIIYDISYGNVRLFILIGFMLGALLYFYGISNYILKSLICLIDKIIILLKKIFTFMVYPINFLLRKIKMLLYPVKLKYLTIEDKAKRRYKFFKFRLKKVSKNRKMLYNKKKQLKKYKRRKGQKFNERRSKNNRIKKENKS